jgi:hypothetical protein
VNVVRPRGRGHVDVRAAGGALLRERSCVCDTAAHFGLATQTGIDPNTLFEFRLQEKLILLIANINYFDFGFCDM